MTRPAWLAACAAVMVSCSQFGSGDAGDAAEDSPHADVQPDTAHDVAERDDGPIPFDVIEDAIRDATADAVDAITPDVTEPPVDVADITTPPGDTGPRAGGMDAGPVTCMCPSSPREDHSFMLQYDDLLGGGARTPPGSFSAAHTTCAPNGAGVPRMPDGTFTITSEVSFSTDSTLAFWQNTSVRCTARVQADRTVLSARCSPVGSTVLIGDAQGAVVSVLTDERVEWSFQSVTLASSGGNPVFTLRNATFRGYVPNGSFLTVPNALR